MPPERGSFSVRFCVTLASSAAGSGAAVGIVGASAGVSSALGVSVIGVGLRSVGRRRRIVLSGAGPSFAGATPMADSREMREVFDFAACCCWGVMMPSAMMPVFLSVACAGIGPVTDLRFCVAFFAVAGATVGAMGAGRAPTTGLWIVGLRMTGFSLMVERPGEADTAEDVRGTLGAAGAGAAAGAGVAAAPNGATFGGTLPPSAGEIGVISTSSAMSVSLQSNWVQLQTRVNGLRRPSPRPPWSSVRRRSSRCRRPSPSGPCPVPA